MSSLMMQKIGFGDAIAMSDSHAKADREVERRRPDWWALEPCVHRRDEHSYEVGHHSEVTNHYIVEVTREINHGPHNAANELGLRIEHKLSELVDDYELVHTDVDRIAPIYDDTLAGRRLVAHV